MTILKIEASTRSNLIEEQAMTHSVTARVNADGVAEAIHAAGLTVIEITRWLDMDAATKARETTEYSIVVGIKR